MSVINQVLNQLEERGVQLDDARLQVRPVAVAGRRYGSRLIWLLALAVLFALAIFAWRHPSFDMMSAGAQVANNTALLAPVAGGMAKHESSGLAAELTSPASRLSLELSAVPLPGAGRMENGAAGEVAHIPVELPPAPRPASPPTPSSARAEKVAVQTTDAGQPIKRNSPAQLAEVEYRKAGVLMQQGRTDDALAAYQEVLRNDAKHAAARQAIVALLLGKKQVSDAERVLQDGLKINPEQTGFAMMLARLQIERGELDPAIAILENSLAHAGQQADYQAFYAALLQRKNRHQEAVAHYKIALQVAPNNGVWLMGCGISLQMLSRTSEAKTIYQRALDSQTLSPELHAFVQQKLVGL